MPGIDANTVLMLHCDGTDGSTSFIDSSASTHIVTANGNAQIDTSESVFGGASGLFDGSGDYLSLTDSSDWDFGSGDFTLDFRVRFNIVASASFLSHGTDGNNFWYCLYFANKLFFEVIVGGSLLISTAQSWTPIINTWYHIAVVRTGTTFKLFINGNQIGVDVLDADAIPNYTGSVITGVLTGFGGYDFNGYIEEVRISKGIARWTTNFTPPIDAYSEESPVETITSYPFYKNFKTRILDKGNHFFDLFKGKLNRKIPS